MRPAPDGGGSAPSSVRRLRSRVRGSAAGRPNGTIELLQLRVLFQGIVTKYHVTLTNGLESWVLCKRYSEFLRLHVSLLEFFRQEELPRYPPKEPLRFKVFARQREKDRHMSERLRQLQEWLIGILAHRAAMHLSSVQAFFNAPIKDEQASALQGVRVRLTGEPGGIAVVVRVTGEALFNCRVVELSLRPVADAPGHDADDDRGDEEDAPEWPGEGAPGVRLERVQLPDADEEKVSAEVVKVVSLQPGTTWEVGARLVSDAGEHGNPVFLKLRLPAVEEIPTLFAPRGGASDTRVSAAAPSGRSENDRRFDDEDSDTDEDTYDSELADERGGRSEPAVNGFENQPLLDGAPRSPQWTLPRSRSARSLGTRQRRREAPEVKMTFRGSIANKYVNNIRKKYESETEEEAEQCSTHAEEGSKSVEALNSIWREQQRLQLEAEARVAAQWVFDVTGHDECAQAAQGAQSLASALETGEALCDLVNSIAPGQIVGILRGQVPPTRRLENLTRFFKACGDLGVEQAFLVNSWELAEGKNLRPVVECILALGAVANSRPDWKGAQLQVSQPLLRRHRFSTPQPRASAAVGRRFSTPQPRATTPRLSCLGPSGLTPRITGCEELGTSTPSPMPPSWRFQH